MIKKYALAASACLAVTLSSGASASSTVDLTITGRILPTSCTPVLSTSTVNLGNISISDLNLETPTPLTAATVAVTVSCDSPAQFALRGIDNNPGSAWKTDDTAFGMGLNGTEKIGYFNMRFLDTSLQGDGVTVIGLNSVDQVNWTAAPITDPEGGSGPAISHGENYLGFGDTGTLIVKPIERLQGTLEVRATIAPRDSLDTTTDITLDGSATIELTYL